MAAQTNHFTLGVLSALPLLAFHSAERTHEFDPQLLPLGPAPVTVVHPSGGAEETRASSSTTWTCNFHLELVTCSRTPCQGLRVLRQGESASEAFLDDAPGLQTH